MAAAVHPLGVPRTKGGQVIFEVAPEVADRVGGRWSGGGWAGRIPEVRGVGFTSAMAIVLESPSTKWADVSLLLGKKAPSPPVFVEGENTSQVPRLTA